MSSGRPRQNPALAGPPEDIQLLERFPRSGLRARTCLVRVTRKGYGPWWFSSVGDGRFDLEPPEGTCYLALDDIAALLEVLGGELAMMISSQLLEERQLHRLPLPQAVDLADLASREVRGHGITDEIHPLVPYDLPQRWAQALRRAGFDGLRYRVRHDPSGWGEGVALFGPAGERSDWPLGEVRPCDEAAIRRRLFEACGIMVVPRPTLDQLQVED